MYPHHQMPRLAETAPVTTVWNGALLSVILLFSRLSYFTILEYHAVLYGMQILCFYISKQTKHIAGFCFVFFSHNYPISLFLQG